MNTFMEILGEAMRQNDLQKAILSRPRSDATLPFKKAVIRPVTVKGEQVYQFTTRVQNQELHENLSASDAVERIDEWCRSAFSDCHLFTQTQEYTIRIQPDGKIRIKRKKSADQAITDDGHNRTKPYLIPDGTPCPFLIETGIMTADGKVRAAKQRKFKQVNRFLELVNDVLPALPSSEEPLSVIDFGCGKSYLTFALHYLLTEIHGRSVNIIGLDRNPSVIAQCADLSTKLQLEGLEFRPLDIAQLPALRGWEQVDLVVSLHACDTATDDTLAQAIKRTARIILAVPCCQHEVAKTMKGEALQGITRYGLLKERFATIATDALRAEILEQHGYATQVVEFINLEHTAKNVLLRAVRRPDDQPPVDRSREIQELKSALGISEIHLERALGSDD